MAHTASLQAKLAANLPLNHHFTLHHLSTPPTPCPALYSAPPGQKPEKTYSESHFLSISITLSPPQKQIQILALEVLIYTTAHLTTIFVAKADSTGYLYLLHLPEGTPSPLKTITSTFLSHLVAHRQRKDRTLVVSLFARAQDQYLFPGSVENPHKHVLNDRRLVRWWCRVLEPVLHAGSTWNPSSSSSCHHRERKSTTSAYLRVPGCDIHETRSFFPLSVRLTPSTTTTTLAPKWHPSRDPLRDLIRSPTTPERCLIPRFPDDPKSRFVDELDEELTEPAPPLESSQQQVKESPSKGKRPGRWRSVRSLEQFWELMAFRQECSSGRLVGFLWGVFEPEGMHSLGGGEREGSPSRKSALPTPADSQGRMEGLTRSSLQRPSSSSPPSSKTSQPQARPEKTAYYFWPPSTRGTVVLPQKHYDRVNKLLLHLDYATLEVAAESTKRWIEDVAMCAGRKEGWGIDVVGGLELPVVNGEVDGQRKEGGAGEGVNVLAAGMVRKKKRARDGEGVDGDASVGGGGVQALSAGLVRKKPKLK